MHLDSNIQCSYSQPILKKLGFFFDLVKKNWVFTIKLSWKWILIINYNVNSNWKKCLVSLVFWIEVSCDLFETQKGTESNYLNVQYFKYITTVHGSK